MAITVDGTSGAMVIIERGAGPQASVSAELIGGVNRANEWKSKYENSGWEAISYGDGKQVLRTDKISAVQDFVDEIRGGAMLRNDAGSGSSISFAGAEAALRLMDEVQMRSLTQGALVVRGNRPDRTLPAPPDKPVTFASEAPKPLDPEHGQWIASEVRSANAATLESRGCDRSRVYALTDEEALIIFECYQKGPVFRAPHDDPRAAYRVVLKMTAGTSISDVSLAYYDPSNGVLGHWRNDGDGCGENARWVFDGEEFYLSSYASMEKCVGLAPGRWPVQWRTRTVRLDDLP